LCGAAGVLLVLPTIITAILKPIIAIDIADYIPLLPGIGLHIGYNVVLPLVISAAAHTMQRMRGPEPITS